MDCVKASKKFEVIKKTLEARIGRKARIGLPYEAFKKGGGFI